MVNAMSDARALQVWMNGEAVGLWLRGRAGTDRFVYDPAWIASSRVRPLSLSLPILADRTISGPVVAHFFDNLLPDDDRIRRRLRARFRVGSSEGFDLLQAIGRDCVGAVQLLPPDVAPTGWDQVQHQLLTDADVASHLREVIAGPGATPDSADLRISIAGAQEKTALLRIGEQWYLPRGATPTTHILKLPLGLVGGRRLDLGHSVFNEWLCAQLLREFGLPVAQTDIATFNDQTVLVVERFDRQWRPAAPGARHGRPLRETASDTIIRLPQEDFCQALGVPPRLKYESEGGPGMAACLRILLGSQRATADINHFLCAQLAFWLLAATDGHAKNFSLFLLPGGAYRMTPLYDVISLWPVIGDGASQVRWHETRLAMAVRSRNTHYTLPGITTRYWHGLAQRSGVPGTWEAMLAMLARVEPAIAAVEARLPEGFHKRTAQAIFRGLRTQCKVWHSGLQALH